MYPLLLLLLLGTIYAQEPDDCSQDDSMSQDEIEDPNGQENHCDMPDTLETTPLNDCQLEKCHNVSIQINNIFGDVCPDKSTCRYQAFNCPTTFRRAQHSCRCRRGNLSSVSNGCANNRIRCFVRRSCSNRQYAWIGVWKPANSCAYVNANGSRLTYTNFAPGQYRRCGSWCVAMNLSNGKWYTFNCCTSLAFVCTI
ncbi:proteoglycan 3-like [Rana temporaria]|uniref:proteoglycan 3-like n=1 Tax=Rana temporaria TaxID=8407 RepID=UPI001AAC8767|nr:proteoglycan 3-like [Rana temporaria]